MFHCTDWQVFIDSSETLKGCFTAQTGRCLLTALRHSRDVSTAQTGRCLLTALRHSRDVSLHRLAGVY